jgi:hypothetical protein
MSYNYEINNTNSKKKSEQSKYNYKTNETDSQTFIFELILKNKFEENIIIRKIKKSSQGTLVTNDEFILYNNINKYILTVMDLNNPENPIIIKDTFDNMLSTNTFLNDMIYLEIIQGVNNYADINYNIL